MLDRFRNAGNSIIVKVLIVLIILSFAVWGINNVFVDSSNGSKLAKVGDRMITAEMLDRQLGQDMERISGPEQERIVKMVKWKSKVVPRPVTALSVFITLSRFSTLTESPINI